MTVAEVPSEDGRSQRRFFRATEGFAHDWWNKFRLRRTPGDEHAFPSAGARSVYCIAGGSITGWRRGSQLAREGRDGATPSHSAERVSRALHEMHQRSVGALPFINGILCETAVDHPWAV